MGMEMEKLITQSRPKVVGLHPKNPAAILNATNAMEMGILLGIVPRRQEWH
jgi:hypothetical protein